MIALNAQIEGVLFVRTEGAKISYLAKILTTSEDSIRESLVVLQNDLQNRGVKLLVSGDTAMLTTHPDLSDTIGALFEEDTTSELTPASLQTLSIILYKGSVTRGEISYMRGVDSRMSLRNLTVRGLIEKAGPDRYRPSPDILRHLGVGSVEELPRFKDIKEALSKELTPTEKQ